MRRYQQSVPVNDAYVLWEDSPSQEWSFGYSDATEVAMQQIRDQSELLRLIAALDRSRTAFVIELRATGFAAAGGASQLPLRQFERLMFGEGNGGVHGQYGSGFVAAFVTLSPFVKSIH